MSSHPCGVTWVVWGRPHAPPTDHHGLPLPQYRVMSKGVLAFDLLTGTCPLPPADATRGYASSLSGATGAVWITQASSPAAIMISHPILLEARVGKERTWSRPGMPDLGGVGEERLDIRRVRCAKRRKHGTDARASKGGRTVCARHRRYHGRRCGKYAENERGDDHGSTRARRCSKDSRQWRVSEIDTLPAPCTASLY